jgi:hypothetical protein
VPRFSRTPGAVRDVGAALGEHTETVIAELASFVRSGDGAAAR